MKLFIDIAVAIIVLVLFAWVVSLIPIPAPFGTVLLVLAGLGAIVFICKRAGFYTDKGD